MDATEAIAKLDELGGDAEISHTTADEILLDFLRANGFRAVADAWDRADDRSGGFWYA